MNYNINLNYINNNNFKVDLLTVSKTKTFEYESTILKQQNKFNNIFSKLKFDFRDSIFYFKQMNKILHKPLNGYYYTFFLSFKKYYKIVSSKDYAHQFCFFLNFKLKNCVNFYFVDKLDNLFFNNHIDENCFLNFFVPSKNSRIDWTLFKYFWGQTKKYPSYYIELDYYSINKSELDKVLFFFKFNTLKQCRKNKLFLFDNISYSSKRKFKLNISNNKYYYKYLKKK